MPRKQGGIGRTGNKHKKVALHDIHRQPKRKRDDADGAGCSRAIEALEHATASAEAAAAASAEALDLADTQVPALTLRVHSAGRMPALSVWVCPLCVP